MSKAAAEVTAQ